MANEVKLPALGENVAGGDVVDVKVKEGDEVKSGQALVEIEAEKSTVEVPSPVAGRVTKLMVKKGDKVKTGQTLALIDGANGKPAEAPAEAAAQPKAETKPAAAPTPKPQAPNQETP